ncbi:prolyl aminopeptidase, partial [Burkholderia multivorans]
MRCHAVRALARRRRPRSSIIARMNRRPERRPSAPSLRRLSRDGCAIAWREAGHPRGHPVVV